MHDIVLMFLSFTEEIMSLQCFMFTLLLSVNTIRVGCNGSFFLFMFFFNPVWKNNRLGDYTNDM